MSETRAHGEIRPADEYQALWIPVTISKVMAWNVLAEPNPKRVEEELLSFRDTFCLGGLVILQSTTPRTSEEDYALVQARHVIASPESRSVLPDTPVAVTAGVGLLGRAWRYEAPELWSKSGKRATRELWADPLLGALANTLENALIVPIVPDRDQGGGGALPDRVERPAGYVCLLNKREHRSRGEGGDKGPPVAFAEHDVLAARSLAHLFCTVFSYEEILESAAIAIVSAMELRDPRNADHSRRVAEGTLALAEQYLREPVGTHKPLRSNLWTLRLAAHLHDIGKMGLSDAAIGDPAEVKDAFRYQRYLHPHAGVAIVEQIRGMDPIVAEVAKHHHEWFAEGAGGYYRDAQADHIPPEARMVAVADTYDSMIRDHPPLRGWSRLAAFIQLRRLRGTRLDPTLVDMFLQTEYVVSELENTITTPTGIDILHMPDDEVLCCVMKAGPVTAVRQWVACSILEDELSVAGADPLACWEHALGDHRLNTTPEVLVGRGIAAIPGARPRRDGARAEKMAFLYVMLSEALKTDSDAWRAAAGVVCQAADASQCLPVLMDGFGDDCNGSNRDIGVLAFGASPDGMYGFAKRLFDALDKKQVAGAQTGRIRMGISYLPNADVRGCCCLMGAGYCAAKAIDDDCQKAVAFFDHAAYVKASGG